MKPRTKRKVKRAVQVTTDTTASLIGGVIRLSLKIIGTILLVFFCTGMLFACVFAVYVKTALTTDLDLSLEDFTLALSSTIYYEDAGGNYQELTVLQSTEERFWVDYENMPEALEHAAVSIEDKRFYKHKGVDWYRTVGAFSNMFLSMKNDFGGSTITQQLIKNLTEEDDVTVQRKLLEIFRALEFEKTYEKWEIMQWYLNTVYFGSGAYGVGAAAQEYFGKEVWDLTIAECASIIGITNNPSLYSPYASRENNKDRQETILWEMYDQGYITHDEYVAAVNEELVFKRGENEEADLEIYSYYEEVVIEDVLRDLQEKKGYSANVARQILYSGGLQIYACIDMNIQNIVDSYYMYPETMPVFWRPSYTQPFQSAIVILDPYNGDIVALSGGVGTKDANFELNRATGAQRPPGSSFKPIASYGPAMELGLITQTTLVNDSPNIKLSGTSWYPKNSGGGNRGVITIRAALQSSLNTVAAQIIDKLTPQVSYNFLTERLGVTSLVADDCSYAPLALGQLTYGITVREMAQAYSAFANDGVFTYSRTYSHINDSEGALFMDNTSETIVAFSANTARNMTDMLWNAVNYGTGTEAALWTMPVAGKTGTTSDDWDRYFVGFTPYYVAAVWTGYDMPEPMYVSGNPACQIFRKIMSKIHEGLEYKSFSRDFTIGKATNIFGDLEEETPTPTATETPSPSPTPTETPSPSIEPSIPPETTAPVTETPTTPPVTTPPVTTPPVTTPPVTTPPVTTPPVTTAPVTTPPVTQTPVTDTPVTETPVEPTVPVVVPDPTAPVEPTV